MSLFDLSINLLEGIIMSSFLAIYFQLDKKIIYISLASIAFFTEITISNYIDSYNIIFIILEIMILWISLIIKMGKKLLLTSFLMCVIANIVLLICNGVSLFLTSFIFEIKISSLSMSASPTIFSFAIILSKIFLICSLAIICRGKIAIKNEIKFKQWWMYLLIIFILFVLVVIVLKIVMIHKVKYNELIFALMLMGIEILLIILLFYRTNRDNERIIEITTKISNTKNKERNFKVLSLANKDMEILLHNSKYFLMLVRSELNKKNYQHVNSLINKRLEEILTKQVVLNTGNVLFDYNFNHSLSKYELKKRNIKFMISLQKNDYFEEDSFIDFIDKILNYFYKDNDIKYLSFDLQNTNQYVILKFILDKHEDIKNVWSERFYKLQKNISFSYSIHGYDNITNISIVVPIISNFEEK